MSANEYDVIVIGAGAAGMGAAAYWPGGLKPLTANDYVRTNNPCENE
jgi:alkyl hydroperoxide reductase subunit AhpF